MPIMAVRDFECDLCRRPFSKMTGDLIMPIDSTCDECLAEIARLDGDDLAEYVARQLAAHYPEYGEKKRNNVLSNMQLAKRMLPSAQADAESNVES
ncbi:MAG: hypothetical protein PVJ34_01415 [Anaerolineae bacterium]|jgi:hypothetical protein